MTVTHPTWSVIFTSRRRSSYVLVTSEPGTGEVFVLEMGEPVKIVDLARNMISLAGYEPETEIAIEFTGPRRGEKLGEELFNEDERSQPTSAEPIVRAVRPASP